MSLHSRRSMLALCALALLAPFLLGQGTATRNIQGKVLGEGDAPLQGAIVYLQSSKSNDIKTFVTTQDGSFLFGYTSTDIDYSVWAMYKGKKSEVKAVSSFNTRKQIYLDLHIKNS